MSKVLNTRATDGLISRHAPVNEEVYASFIVQKTSLRLVSREGRCTLLYAPQMAVDAEKSLDVGMAGPCNFVGTGKDAIPQHFVYGKGAERRAVFLITGGHHQPSSPTSRTNSSPRAAAQG